MENELSENAMPCITQESSTQSDAEVDDRLVNLISENKYEEALEFVQQCPSTAHYRMLLRACLWLDDSQNNIKERELTRVTPVLLKSHFLDKDPAGLSDMLRNYSVRYPFPRIDVCETLLNSGLMNTVQLMTRGFKFNDCTVWFLLHSIEQFRRKRQGGFVPTPFFPYERNLCKMFSLQIMRGLTCETPDPARYRQSVDCPTSVSPFSFCMQMEMFEEAELLHDTGGTSMEELFQWTQLSAYFQCSSCTLEQMVDFLNNLHQPQSLQSLCAISVSKLLGAGTDRESAALSLGLPQILVDFVLFRTQARKYEDTIAKELHGQVESRSQAEKLKNEDGSYQMNLWEAWS